MKSFSVFLIVSFFFLASPIRNYCQTISPIYINNDSIHIQKIQFINIKTGLSLLTETNGRLLHVNEIYEDTIRMIIPFKNGTKIILDTVETKYFSHCVIDVEYNKNADSTCGSILYSFGDRLMPRTTGYNCKKEFNKIQINSSNPYYYKMTGNAEIYDSKRLKLLKKLHKKHLSMK